MQSLIFLYAIGIASALHLKVCWHVNSLFFSQIAVVSKTQSSLCFLRNVYGNPSNANLDMGVGEMTSCIDALGSWTSLNIAMSKTLYNSRKVCINLEIGALETIV